MKRCPICNSKKITKHALFPDKFRCDKCGYEHDSNSRRKVIFSKTGNISEGIQMGQ